MLLMWQSTFEDMYCIESSFRRIGVAYTIMLSSAGNFVKWGLHLSGFSYVCCCSSSIVSWYLQWWHQASHAVLEIFIPGGVRGSGMGGYCTVTDLNADARHGCLLSESPWDYDWFTNCWRVQHLCSHRRCSAASTTLCNLTIVRCLSLKNR